MKRQNTRAITDRRFRYDTDTSAATATDTFTNADRAGRENPNEVNQRETRATEVSN